MKTKAQIRAGFLCVDCKADTLKIDEYYMVTHRIWRRYGCGDGMLCLKCLTTRMGRLLTPKDLLPCWLNQQPRYKSKLAKWMQP